MNNIEQHLETLGESNTLTGKAIEAMIALASLDASNSDSWGIIKEEFGECSISTIREIRNYFFGNWSGELLKREAKKYIQAAAEWSECNRKHNTESITA